MLGPQIYELSVWVVIVFFVFTAFVFTRRDIRAMFVAKDGFVLSTCLFWFATKEGASLTLKWVMDFWPMRSFSD